VILRGVVEAGTGEAASFMSLDWVRREISRLAGFDPYPGTLNVRLLDDHVERWRAIRTQDGLRVTPPDPAQCGARLVPVVVSGDIRAGVIVPDVTRYGAHVLEIVAPVHLRSRCWLRNGDVLALRYERPRSDPRPH
jgi:CTP-dependent riboflavin kinase